MVLLQQMVVLFIIMIIGFLCQKKGMLNEEANKRISGLVVNVANPALVLSASINKENVIEGMELLASSLLAIGMFGVLILIARFLPVILKIDKQNHGTYKAMTVFSNIGFMGFPVISAVYGSEALLYASVFLLPFNILIYTYGVNVMQQNGTTKQPFQWKKIINTGVVACIISLFIYLTRLPIPQFAEDVITSLSNLTAPLSMMLIGASMTKIKGRELLSDYKLLIFSIIKMILIPVCGMLLIMQFDINPLFKGVCLIMLATPVGSMTAMLAQQYDGDYELASKGVALTTVLSVVTIPLLSAVLGI